MSFLPPPDVTTKTISSGWRPHTGKRRVWQSLSCAFHCAQTLTYHSARSTVTRSKRPTWGVPPAPDFRG